VRKKNCMINSSCKAMRGTLAYLGCGAARRPGPPCWWGRASRAARRGSQTSAAKGIGSVKEGLEFVSGSSDPRTLRNTLMHLPVIF
jgi:hypothetical protein